MLASHACLAHFFALVPFKFKKSQSGQRAKWVFSVVSVVFAGEHEYECIVLFYYRHFLVRATNERSHEYIYHVRACASISFTLFWHFNVHVLIDFNYLKRQSCVVRYYYCYWTEKKMYRNSTRAALFLSLSIAATFAAIFLQAVARFCQSILITIRISLIWREEISLRNETTWTSPKRFRSLFV